MKSSKYVHSLYGEREKAGWGEQVAGLEEVRADWPDMKATGREG